MKEVKLAVLTAEELQVLLEVAVRRGTAHESATEWVDARSAPVVRGRRFHRLAEEKAFPSARVGRRRIARRVDVDAYLEAELTKPQSEPRAPVDDAIGEALAQGKLRVLKGRR